MPGKDAFHSVPDPARARGTPPHLTPRRRPERVLSRSFLTSPLLTVPPLQPLVSSTLQIFNRSACQFGRLRAAYAEETASTFHRGGPCHGRGGTHPYQLCPVRTL